MSAGQVLDRPVFVTRRERLAVGHLEDALRHTRAGEAALVLLWSSGETTNKILVPDSLRELMVSMFHTLAEGSGVTVIPVDAELTTQQAAEMLSVSRPFLIGLLEEDTIPFHKVGTHRRIRVQDLAEYKVKRDRERTEKLKQLSTEAQELGLYD